MLFMGLSESFQFYLLSASNKIAIEKGHCEYFGRTKYADAILPIDTYKKDVDEISSQKLQLGLGRSKNCHQSTWVKTLNTLCTNAIREFLLSVMPQME